MAMSYAELTGDKNVPGSIRSWTNYARIDVESVLIDAQAMIYQQLRVRQMRAFASINVAPGDAEADLPVGYIQNYKMRDVTNDIGIEYIGWEDMEQYRTWTNGVLDSGDPYYFSVVGEKIEFNSTVINAALWRMLYYKTPDYLSDSLQTNFLTTRYPHLLRSGCLAMAAVFEHDDASYGREMQRFSAVLSGINTQADLDDHAGIDIRIIGP